MTYRSAKFLIIYTGLTGLLFASAQVNAGSFRDFILDSELKNTAQLVVEFAADSESAACMQCHNGNKAASIRMKHADMAMNFTSHGSSNHPVGMSYERYARKSPASYVASVKLDSRIRLENGQVTCISCHETRQNNSHSQNVVAANNVAAAQSDCTATKAFTTGLGQTRLCMSCHAM